MGGVVAQVNDTPIYANQVLAPLKKEFAAFKNKCFYDLIALKNGQLMVCGGASGISLGNKRIPKGFIATLDKDLKEIHVVWKKYLKFVWSVLQLDDESVLAISFNGLNTKIIKSDNLKSWANQTKVDGLVYKMGLFDNRIWYCGTRSKDYKKDGIAGILNSTNNLVQKIYTHTGCLWGMNTIGGQLISVTETGQLLKIDQLTGNIDTVKVPKALCLYDTQKISESKLLIIGHGKGAYIMDFNTAKVQ